ncbi:hypothetical protein FHX09_001555 [Rhizobium sp. BK538]|nr:hypothetical protein [Rhizobium sp. BK060]MBB4167724.1 hypothetical protein [Rhizobium sp. BK538]TCM64401.1 hypothetical protein EV291_1466 [Rhizobium sp. BK068]
MKRFVIALTIIVALLAVAASYLLPEIAQRAVPTATTPAE